MKQACSWCDAEFESERSEDSVAGAVCDECSRRLLAECGVQLGRYLEGLEAPVMLVDAEGVVLAASPQALEKLGLEESEVTGRLCGDVLRCVNATLPGGCGKTPNCPDCGFRNLVVATAESGTAFARVPVRLNIGSADAPRWLGIVVTTEHFSGVAMLRIDEIAEIDGIAEEGEADDASP